MSPTRDPYASLRSGLELVTLRASVDPEFRAHLLRDPHEAIASTYGVELPRLRIRFVEKGSDVDLLVVLPEMVERAQAGDDWLDQVMGGWQRAAAPRVVSGTLGVFIVPFEA